jgi:hypothetical protein
MIHRAMLYFTTLLFIYFRLLNKLRVAAGMSPVKYQKNALTPFVALENIEIFNKGTEEYGVEHEGLFQSADLYEAVKGPFIHVINCLNKLGFVVRSLSFSVLVNVAIIMLYLSSLAADV